MRTGLRSEEKASLFPRGKKEGMILTVGRQGVLEKVLLPLWRKGSEVLVTQSCLTLCDLTDCSPPGSSVLGIFQARTLEWASIIPGIFPHKDQTRVSHVSSFAGGFFTC